MARATPHIQNRGGAGTIADASHRSAAPPCPKQVASGERTRFTNLTRSEVLSDEDQSHGRIRRGKAGRGSTVERVFGIGRHHRYGKHLQQRQPALNRIVGVEARGEDGVASPCPPNQDEERRESQEPGQGVVRAQRSGDLADGRDEDEIEEEFEPGGLFDWRRCRRSESERLCEARHVHANRGARRGRL
jgi:hypothetical protein